MACKAFESHSLMLPNSVNETVPFVLAHQHLLYM